MTKKSSTKRALVVSVIALCLCFTMLVGTTFAWFTDSVSSTGNVIQTGKLKIGFYWAEGSEDPAKADWNDASEGAIFNHNNWEPGYAEAKHLKVTNDGTLAFNYRMRIVPNGVVSELADVIDVYYFKDATIVDREMLKNAPEVQVAVDIDGEKTLIVPNGNGIKVGTLTEVMSTDKNMTNIVVGSRLAGQEPAMHTLVLKMQESAGNEYQEMDLGCTFSVEMIATQMSHESDSIDNKYDAEVTLPEFPAAMVRPLKDLTIDTTGSKIGKDLGEMTLDVGYKFQPTMSLENAEISDYELYHVDFVVKASNKVPANSMALAGYYDAWCSLNNDKWVALDSDSDIAAGTEIRLVNDMISTTVNWADLCEYGNDGIGFLCGAVDLTGENEGTILTVELRLYETPAQGECSNGGGCKHREASCETGKYTVVGKFEYTFGGNYVTAEDGTELFYAEDGEVVLYNTADVTATEYTVPADVTTLGDYCFTYNESIKTVTVPGTVESLGRAFDSNTTIETVVLQEGIEQIDSRTFKATTALKEVVIPASVETIADNAFQKSAIKSITIPATVKTIGETAFGSSLIEEVIFEGNTAVEGYAFRGCTKLRTVYMYGDDNKFVPSTLNGRNSTWFCNSESNNPNVSNIDFYVMNDTVAARVKVAMGAEAGNTDVIIMGNEGAKVVSVKNLTEFKGALSAATTNTVITFSSNIAGDAIVVQPGDANATLVINGNGFKYDGSIQIQGLSTSVLDDTLVIKNINFETSKAVTADNRDAFVWSMDSSAGSPWRYAHNVTIENCTFTAVAGSAAERAFAGIKFQQAYNITVKNCVATNLHSLIQAESCKSTITIDGCEVVNGKNGVSLNNTQNAIVKNTTIESVADGGYGIRHKGQEPGYALTVENCTVEAFVPVLLRNVTGKNYTATFTGNVELTATNTFGYELVASAGDWDNDAAQPSAPTGTYTLVGAEAFVKNVG